MQYWLPSAIFIFDVAFPCALLLWLWKSRAKSRLRLFSIAGLTVAYLAAIKYSILGFWHVWGIAVPYVYFLVLFVVIVVRWRSGFPDKWVSRPWAREFWVIGLNVALTVAAALLVARTYQARTFDRAALELSSPLRGEGFYVVSGGANASVNQHFGGTQFAMDIVQLNAFGLRSRSALPYPDALNSFSIFGAEVIAPCAGEVIAVEDHAPNRRPLHPDGGKGNYIALYCNGHTVRLLHLQSGSQKVEVGQSVVVGQPLANVGNSGNTIEPHLHIDAVAGRNLITPSNVSSFESVPIKIDHSFLIKGDTFSH